MAASELISQREYARRRGVSHMAVQRAIKSGRISTVDDKIDPGRADREWEQNTDQSKPRNRVTGRPNHTRAAGAPSEPMVLADDSSGGGTGAAAGYAKARAARELYQAQLVKLELDRKRGELVRADEVRLGLGLFTQAVLQGAFILAKATDGPGRAVESVDHLRRYVELLFGRRGSNSKLAA